MEIQGKVAVVTGSGYGIGRGIARRLAAAGASVVVNDVHDGHGEETARLIAEAGGAAHYFHADVTRDGELLGVVRFAKERFGGLDILVNNAGFGGSPPYFPEAEPGRWQRVLDVYLRAVMLGTQYGVQAMEKRAGGAIVNISSGAGIGFQPHSWPEYAAAKAAVWRLTAALGDLQQRMNVRVNCVCPGWVATETVREYTSRMTLEERAAAKVPDSMLAPADIGDVVVQLVSDDTLAGRVMLYLRPGEARLVPVESEV